MFTLRQIFLPICSLSVMYIKLKYFSWCLMFGEVSDSMEATAKKIKADLVQPGIQTFSLRLQKEQPWPEYKHPWLYRKVCNEHSV